MSVRLLLGFGIGEKVNQNAARVHTHARAESEQSIDYSTSSNRDTVSRAESLVPCIVQDKKKQAFVHAA